MKLSHNQKRYRTYNKLSKGMYLQPGLYKKGIFRRAYWVSHREKAELVRSMSTSHLKNTVQALGHRHPEIDASALVAELKRRAK